MGWFRCARNASRLQVVVNSKMKYRDPQKAGHFLSSCVTLTFSKMILYRKLFSIIFTEDLRKSRKKTQYRYPYLMSVLEPWTSVIRGISEQLTSKEKKKTICFLCFIKAIYLFIHVYIYMTYINQLNDYMYNRIFRS